MEIFSERLPKLSLISELMALLLHKTQKRVLHLPGHAKMPNQISTVSDQWVGLGILGKLDDSGQIHKGNVSRIFFLDDIDNVIAAPFEVVI